VIWYSNKLVTGLVRRYTRDNQIATVRVVRMDEPIMDVDDDLLAKATGVVYSGRGRVARVSGPVQYMLGEEPQYFSSTTISIPDTHEADAADGSYFVGDPVVPRVDDIAEVLAHPVDPRLAGAKYRVTDVSHGGQFGPFLTLSVIGVQYSKRWSHPSANEVDLTVPPEWVV
jgi:hypothetical protein